MLTTNQMYHNICLYHNTYVLYCCLPSFVNLIPYYFFEHFANLLYSFMATCFVHHCCLLPQFLFDQSNRIVLVTM
jgi:hypothetical protein